ncbi:RHS repeat-associated core domain-containing protein [Streptomyces sp. yr375]|uniref:polymorphic toxin-type HINT domain-containing protein n=1 Tax=Streptomyces sp. yr375 TaxID=1761906 RepID=UPI0008C52D5C|nr:polymorphic toxin-type HINT domain-containing protein [Streptomyces sp. yr375]SER01244.1 RHS repeat-associated core domain-containing protein [Streptomyces sp. yr375]
MGGLRRTRLWVVAVTASALVATGLGAAPAVWATERHGHNTADVPDVRNGTAVPFTATRFAKKNQANAAAARTAAAVAKPVVWPVASAATLPVAGRITPAKATSVGKLPVKVSAPATGAAPAKVAVKVAAHQTATALGINGTVLSVARADGRKGAASTRLTLDYSGFANAYGGDYASRLTLVRLPACALTTPAVKKCRTTTPVATTNDVAHHTLTTTAPVNSSAVTAFAATAAAATSGAGSYQATSLNPSAAWNAGGSSGDFTWSYPLYVPPSNGGPAPNLAITYDSQSVDGRLPSTNNQPSWVGEGFDLSTSYIERSYDSCDDDGQKDKNDECWANDNATLVLGGKSSPLIKDRTSGDWHPKTDDGERVVRSTGATNGDNDGEYWTVTTEDGTQYVFGKNRLPGWTTGAAVTNSTYTAPVFGDDSGEPGYDQGTAFSGRALTQAWRWNLDYVVDPHGNAMSYWYTKETNYYAKSGTTTDNGTAYDRGGYLSRIDYGITSATVFGTAPEKVTFTTAERCLVTSGEDCSSLTSTTAAHWPDVPFDQICASGKVCKATGPTFFSRKRLTGVTTSIWDASLATPAYRDVDSWALAHSFPDPGDGTSAGLWLKSITRTGKDGATTAMPPVTFDGIQLFNRVDTTHDDIAALVKWRVRSITSETGSVLTVNYSDPQCVAGTTMPSSPDSDTLRCFPTYWQPPFTADPQLDWFHKYVITQVTESDPTGNAPLKETDYTYNGSPAWHYDTDNVTSPAKRKTWSVWRGYGSVTSTSGDAQSTRTKTVSTYFRGMDGDKQSDGTTRTAKVTDSTGTAVTDADPLAGTVRESIAYNGSAEVSGTITDPWIRQTGTDGTRASAYTRAQTVHDRTDLSSGGTRDTTVTTTYDDTTGAALTVDDSGDAAVTGDEQCTRTTLADNTSAWLRAFPVRVETVDVACDSTTARPDDVVSDVRTLYDSQAYGTAPTLGDETSTQRLSSYSGGSPVYQTVSTSHYDSQGRVDSVKDTNAATVSTTKYTPATGGPLTATVTTDAKSYATTTNFDPARGIATSVIDPNSKRTDYAYDGLGRVTGLWLANRSKSASQPASLVYSYAVSNTAASVVSTGKLNNDGTTYDTTYALYDALLRPRQTQTPAPGGGRVIAETKYDSRGLAVEADADYTDTSNPSGTLATITSAVPAQTLTTYDGAGRPTAADFYADGAKRWTTTTSYGGDRTTVTPPHGGIATTTLTDTLGRTTETRQYDSGSPSGSYTSIKYAYDAKSRLKSVVDDDGNTWSYGYDLMGRRTSATDPDAGTTTTAYNELDQVAATTTAVGTAEVKTLSYSYDVLGRQTDMYDGTTKDAAHELARWTYDSIAKGQPTSAIRYVGGSTGQAYISQVGAYDSLYRPTLTRVTIPSVTGEEALAGSYTSTIGYNLDGTVQVTSDPAAGGLPSESLTYGYNDLSMPTTLKGATGYVQDTSYTKLSDIGQVTLGVSASDTAKWLQITNTYEDGTHRLKRELVTDDAQTAPVQDTAYTYDDYGNPTKVATHADATDDVQCYRYDGHDRLSEAWTATDGCSADPSTAVLGGPAPYWQSFAYDDLGNRKTQVDHATTTGGNDSTTSFVYPTPGTGQAHTLTSSTTVTAGTTTANSYTYDASGNTRTRTLNGKTQTLDWDDEGHLAKVTNADGTSASYLYDAGGNRLLSRDASGTTLYLGDTEVHLVKGTTTTTGTRYYAWAGQTIAVRSSSGSLQWQVTDAHDTAETAVDATTQAITRRRLDPFGNTRGTQPTSAAWLGDKGFVAGIQDTTSGLTHLGAREYDPTIGRFVSDDPILELTDAQQIDGYTYAADNPVRGSDPSGLQMPADQGCAGSSCAQSDQKSTLVDTGSVNDGGTHHSGGGGSHHSGGGGSHHSCGWSFSCHVSGLAHKAYHLVQQHPVIAAVVATAVVVGVVACVAATAGGCGAVLAAGAEGFTAGAEAGSLSGALVGASVGVAAEGGAVIAGAAGIAGAGAAAVAKGTETASAAKAATRSGAKAADTAAEGTAAAGAARGGQRAEAAAPRSGAAKCNHSFLPATKVLMADGHEKKIKDIKAGDKVRATDPETGKSQPRTVEKLITTKDDKDFATITIRDGGKSSKIVATVTHPFWVDSKSAWVDAGHLKAGMRLHAAAGLAVAISSVEVWHEEHLTHDLTVSVNHTYYVLAGSTPVLVHNCGGDEGTALVHAHVGDGNNVHFTVEVMDGGGNITHSELMPNAGHTQTAIRDYQGLAGTSTFSFRLPNSGAARAFQAQKIGTGQGRYDFLTNSCLTHVCDVLQKGGVTDLPDTGVRIAAWARRGLQSAFRDD